jgi:hypothetical protein
MTDAATFIHIVYFWLRDEETTDAAPAVARALAEGCRLHLASIPGVLRLEVGFPAGTQRDVVDNSYGVALVVEFSDSAAHDFYQSHPDHLRFIDTCSHLWRRVQVYDTLILGSEC